MTTFSTPSTDKAELDKLYQDVIENMKSKGLRPFSFPRIPHILEVYTEVEYQGKIYKVSNLPPGVHIDDTAPLAPSNMENVSDEILEHLLVYWHARAAHAEGVVGEERTRRDLAKEAYTRILEDVMIELEGKINPMTEKKYTETARKESSRHSPRVSEAYDRYFRSELYYQWAETVAKSIRSIPEMLNRVRMAREQKMTHLPGGARGDGGNYGIRGRRSSSP